ncbi:hypothetical protein NHX12_015373, partial [Muraenolepis orangiensis]
ESGDHTATKKRKPAGHHLLCVDYKLLSKALATRLGRAVEQLIHRDQTYCVPGRSMEKAFDRVEHSFLWKVMEKFGFSAGFIAKIKVLYNNIESVLKFNGTRIDIDIDSLVDIVREFSSASAARVNWKKSEALAVGEWSGGLPVLPQNMVWRKDGFKYLGVFLGKGIVVLKNWEDVIEKIEGKLS